MAKKNKSIGLPKGAHFIRKENVIDPNGNIIECSVYKWFCSMEQDERKGHFYYNGEKWIYNGEAF